MCSAETGSGKTAAFLIPILSHLYNQHYNSSLKNKQQGLLSSYSLSHNTANMNKKFDVDSLSAIPKCIILVPTRELCKQIEQEVHKLQFDSPIQSLSIYGGTNLNEQAIELAKGKNDILIATPGRLYDLMNRKIISLEYVDYLVLDEADRMLDMGFEPQIRQIIHYIPNNRQTYMFSATFPTSIQQLAQDYLNSTYIYVQIGLIGRAATTINQKIYSSKWFI